MATNQVLQTTGTAIIVANSTYSPATNTALGAYQAANDIDLINIATQAARQSTKIDLLSPHAEAFLVELTMEMDTDPVTGETLDLYGSQSASGTAAVGNMGGCTGADGAYTGYATMTLAESLKQLDYIGSVVLGTQNKADGVIIAPVGIWAPTQQYACLVFHNNTSDSTNTVDSIEMAIRLTPIIPDIQAAA